ncbi:hypothetical protein FO519_005239 [Halicephalobus sp. NKZ332]|nr:hypothetical protein FO519_005239 [Halicephalobus sp. NKZ332]
MNAGARAAQLVSQVSKDFFITAAQAAVQKPSMDQESEFSTPTFPAKCDDENSDDEAAGTAGGGDDEIYEVDRILQTKMQGRTRMFLVRWKNYGPEADSWEPMDMLKEGASEAVNEFMVQYEKDKATKKKTGAKKRGRPPGNNSRKESSQSLGKTDDDPEPPSQESSESEDEDGDGETNSMVHGFLIRHKQYFYSFDRNKWTGFAKDQDQNTSYYPCRYYPCQHHTCHHHTGEDGK